MKKIWVYLLGVLTGVVVTIAVLLAIAAIVNSKSDERKPDKRPDIETKTYSGASFFDEPGDVINESDFKVFQALGDGVALANGKGEGYSVYLGLTVLLYNEDGMPYYDDQIVSATQGMCFRQIGIYRYQTRGGMTKTVPIVMMMERFGN